MNESEDPVTRQQCTPLSYRPRKATDLETVITDTTKRDGRQLTLHFGYATFSEIVRSADMIRNVTFTCPETGERVDVLVPGVPEEEVNDPYRSVTCPACGWSHAVDPHTGRVLGETDEQG